MTQLSPEVTLHFQGAARPKRHESDLDSSHESSPEPDEETTQFERGYDMVPVETSATGPIKVPSLVEKRVRDVATIALVNPAESFSAYEKLKTRLDGIDLKSVLPNIAVQDRQAVLAQELIGEKLSGQTGELLIGVDLSKIKSPEQKAMEDALVKERDEQIETLHEEKTELRMTILKLRHTMKQAGATEEMIQQFDMVAEIMPAPEREALQELLDAQEKRSAFEAMKSKVGGVLSKLSVKRVGIFRPTSE